MIRDFHHEDNVENSDEDQDLENEIAIVTNFETMKTSFNNFDEYTHF